MLKIVVFYLNILFFSVIFAEVPSYIPVCGRRNPNLDECVKKSVETLRPKLSTGIPELDVPSIDPMVLDVPIPVTDLPDFKATASNIKIYNAPNFEIRLGHVDLENQKIITKLYFKKLRFQGDYDVHAKILVPINAKGTLDLDIEDVDAYVIMSYVFRNTKKGQQIYFTSASTKVNIKDYRSHFISKEGPDVTINDAINAVINTNRGDITDSVIPSLERIISSELLKIANKICKNFTYDELFPDRE